MQPTKIDNRQEDIFKSRLSNELNPKHEMMILSRLIPWDSLEVEFADLYQSVRNVGGQPPKPIRLMIGILLLQHLHNLSDEQVVRGWVENPYWQFFFVATTSCNGTFRLIHLLSLASEIGLEPIAWKKFSH
jgi:IS5 family transposase